MHLPVRRVVVGGPSMVPTLRPGDILLVRWRPGRIRPDVGDVVVVTLPDGRPLGVKRVVSGTTDGVQVRGDNPAASTDSRTLGVLPMAAVQGRVICRLWPRPGPLARFADLPR